MSCQKTVVDFTQKSKDEIKQYFSSITGKVCGQFRSEQLSPTKQPAFRLHLSRLSKFAAALFLAFGSLLFTSCNNAKQLKGKVAISEYEHLKGDVLIIPETPDSNTRKSPGKEHW